MDFAERFKPDENGLFPAAPNSSNNDMANYYWLRDNYWIWRSGFYQEEIKEAFTKIVENISNKLAHHSRNQPVKNYEFIHPRYNSYLEEAQGEWGRPQIDSIAYLLDVVEKEDLIKKLLGYLSTLGVVRGYGPWEEPPKKLHPYSAKILYNVLERNDFNYADATILYEIQEYAFEIAKLHTRLYRDDLEIVMATAVDKTYPTVFDVEPVINSLEGRYGLRRYLGDTWNGETHSTDTEWNWPLGLCFAYLATGNQRFIQKLDYIHFIYPEGLPEMINPVNGEANINTPLIWAEAMYAGIKQGNF